MLEEEVVHLSLIPVAWVRLSVSLFVHRDIIMNLSSAVTESPYKSREITETALSYTVLGNI